MDTSPRSTASALGVAAGPPVKRRDWNTRSLSELTGHLVLAFHDPLRQELPRLRGMAARVQRHSDPYRHVLAVVLYEVDRFTAELLPHMETAERELFPLVGRLEAGHSRTGDGGHFHQLQSALQADHLEADRALQILSKATDRYTPPPQACPTLRSLYQGLSEVEQLVQRHAHLENNVLFPRAAALLAAAR